ncbi:MAG TPA: tRNA (guanosine(46)-N7)-methyltransferase TrmB [Gammaproteobacteria bacterium]|nr:tRNA (guanosine(46)-N7)-methyltransferase TrmB [Gammaproteobacteria bacterium]
MLTAIHLRKVRSFVRRPGRITPAQQRALDELGPRFGVADGGDKLDLVALFGRDAPRVLDIGFGDGEALVTCAVNSPGVDYLGVEVHEPGIGHLFLLLEKAALSNVRVIGRDAADVLPQRVPNAAFNAVNLFFPDPWPKKRHHKRRLVQAPFLAEVARVLKTGGLFHLATDWPDYERHSRELLDPHAELEAVPHDELHDDPLAFRPPTKFERRGRRLGHDVFDLYYRKRAAAAR